MLGPTKKRLIAIATSGALPLSTFLSLPSVSSARADENFVRKAHQYKTGASILGAASAYFGLKSKKAVPAIIARAGASYAHRKSQEYDRQSDTDRNHGYYSDSRGSHNEERGDDRYDGEPCDDGHYYNEGSWRSGDSRSNESRHDDSHRGGDYRDGRQTGYPDDDPYDSGCYLDYGTDNDIRTGQEVATMKMVRMG